MITKKDILRHQTEISFTHPAYKKIPHNDNAILCGYILGGSRAKEQFIYMSRYRDTAFLDVLCEEGYLGKVVPKWLEDATCGQCFLRGLASNGYRVYSHNREGFVKLLNTMLDLIPDLVINITDKKTGDVKTFKSGSLSVSLDDFFKIK